MAQKKKQPKKTRNVVVLEMILNTKPGVMRDRRLRRQNDAGRSWKREEW